MWGMRDIGCQFDLTPVREFFLLSEIHHLG
jgi:hypothetical protein